jgi:predicted anti-sigma-YlaC factor YlaD
MPSTRRSGERVREDDGHECACVRAHISARLDSGLSEFEEARLAAHLDRCRSCGSCAVALERIARLLRTAPYERPGNAIVIPNPRRVLRRVRVAAGAAAVLVGVGFAGVHLGARGHDALRASVGLSASTGSTPESERSTYLDSVDYEKHLIAVARAAYESSRKADVAHE